MSISQDSDDATKCDVNFPVVFVRKSKGHSIQWASDEKNIEYWVHFKTVDPASANVNPLDPQDTYADVPADGYSSTYKMKWDPGAKGSYYQYEILDKYDSTDPSKNHVCKPYDDDRDTGVNVKR